MVEETKSPVYKVVICGDVGVGKTTVLRKFLNYPEPVKDEFIECYFKTFEVESQKKVELEFWDMPP